MTRAQLLQAAALLLGLLSLPACSPGLNWRTVQLGHLSALLPCKPDHASRPVTLAGQTVEMEMAGCETAGMLFAISRTRAADATQAAQLMAALRQATLAQVQAAAVHPMPNSGDAQTSFDVRLDGKRSDGTGLQARVQWRTQGAEVYQIAAYGTHLDSAQTEPLFGEAHLQ